LKDPGRGRGLENFHIKKQTISGISEKSNFKGIIEISVKSAKDGSSTLSLVIHRV
jgi:hypothetical protein